MNRNRDSIIVELSAISVRFRLFFDAEKGCEKSFIPRRKDVATKMKQQSKVKNIPSFWEGFSIFGIPSKPSGITSAASL